MSDSSRRERGLAKFNEVYCGDVPAPPPGAMPFFDLMLEQLFAEIWTRPELSQRDRRLVTMGVLACGGASGRIVMACVGMRIRCGFIAYCLLL